jgi:C4-dicarboxylate-specific signal transduction histidine kinase
MKLSKLKSNIYIKVSVIVFAGLLVPALIIGVIEFNNLKKELITKAKNHVTESTNLMATGLSRALWDYSSSNVESIVKVSLSDTEITKVTVVDSFGRIFYKQTISKNIPTDHSGDNVGHTVAPIIHNDVHIGNVAIEYSLANVNRVLKEYLSYFILMRLGQLFLALGAVLALMHWGVLTRINRLSSQAQKLDQQILDQPFIWEEGDPINELGLDLENARQSLNKLFLEVKEKNEQLSNLNVQLENKVKARTLQIIHSARMAALGEMAAGVAHEINNPLTVIIVKAKSLIKALKLKKINEDELAHHLEKIIHMGDRINKIVKGLRSFSRNSEKDQMKITPINDIFTETLDLCQQKLKSDNIELRLDVLPDYHLECRKVEISQVLLNLINNAADAIKDQSSKWIEIKTAIVNVSTLEVRVTDSGEGINYEIASKIMQPFFTTKDVDQGTGLGLSISSGIIEDHQGKLWLDQTFKNTSFVFQIPLSKS